MNIVQIAQLVVLATSLYLQCYRYIAKKRGAPTPEWVDELIDILGTLEKVLDIISIICLF